MLRDRRLGQADPVDDLAAVTLAPQLEQPDNSDAGRVTEGLGQEGDSFLLRFDLHRPRRRANSGSSSSDGQEVAANQSGPSHSPGSARPRGW